jgi:hypothetical protein
MRSEASRYVAEQAVLQSCRQACQEQTAVAAASRCEQLIAQMRRDNEQSAFRVGTPEAEWYDNQKK